MPKCILYVDGASRGNPGPAAIGASLQNAEGEEIDSVSEFIGETTNNQAEYCALIEGLKLAKKRGFDDIEVRADSELIVRQVKGEYRVKDQRLKLRHSEVTELLQSFRSFKIRHVPREENARADELANAALDRQ
ncbi:MAG TPA: ribonuclease HI family protein [Bdellovibrionota bacterium]|nr:ribonuclease HI family protein [Bdellovibrionota bacterium]